MPRDLVAAIAEALGALVTPVATDPRKLKPGELCRLLNSTPAGEVLDDRRLRKHRTRAGSRIGDGKSIDLLRYAAWLVGEYQGPAARSEGSGAPPPVSQETVAENFAAINAADAAAAYERKKTREANRNAAAAAKKAEVGELPPVVDPARRDACERDLKLFCETYLPETFSLEWSPDQLELVKQLETVILTGGKLPCAMPRGGGKSTIGKAAVLWAILYGHRRYAILIAANNTLAERLLRGLKKQLLTNDRLRDDFPEVCVPIRKVGNVANRCNGQTYRGELTLMEWGNGQIILPRIPCSRSCESIISCSGMDGGIRGANINDRRPDLAFVDDPQTKKSAKSKLQTEYRLGIITADVRGLAGPDTEIAIYAAVTVIYPGDLADQLLDPELNPEWQGKRYKLLYAFPTDMEKWREYWRRRKASLQNGGKGEDATAFYKKNRAAMDAGARVAWEGRKPACLSALQYAMNLFFENEAAFFAEYQNDPKRAADGEEFVDLDAAELRFRNDGLGRDRAGRDIVPLKATHFVAHVDVQHNMLYWGALACDDSLAGSFYSGAWPKQRLPYYSKRDADPSLADTYPGTKVAAVRAGLIALLKHLRTREWRRQDDTPQALELVLVDWADGTMKDVVAEVCRLPEFFGWAKPAGGRGIGAKKAPIEKYSPRPGEKIGQHWIEKRDLKRAVVFYEVDSNYWKSHVAAGLTAAAGDAGALHFSGAERTDQRLLADHCTSEIGRPVKDLTSGRIVVEWEEKPNRDNDHFDNLANCCAAASMRGCQVDGAPRPRRPKKRRKPSVSNLNC